MNGCEFNIAVSALACAIAKDKTADELSLLSVFFTQLGDSLATIQIADDCYCAKNGKDDDIDT